MTTPITPPTPPKQDVQNPPGATMSIGDMSKAIKTKYPQYSKMDNTELVSKVIGKYPTYQKQLTTDALKQITEKGSVTPNYGFSLGHMYKAVKGVAEGSGKFAVDAAEDASSPVTALFDPQMAYNAKVKFANDIVQPMYQEWNKAQELKQKGGAANTVEAGGHELAGDLPLLGPIAAEFADRIGHVDIGGALAEGTAYALMGKTGKDISPEDVKSLGDGFEKVSKRVKLADPFQKVVHEDAYIQEKGLDLQNKFGEAKRAALNEVGKHAKAVSDVVDSQNPNGVINASAEAQHIKGEFQKYVASPMGTTPWLQNLLKHAPDVRPGGLWSFDEAKQFRSSVYDALRKSQGVGQTVLTSAYKSLTDKLASTAEQYGMKPSWDHYNTEMSKLTHNFGDTLDSIENANHGIDVYKALEKSGGGTKELTNSLQKYGLNPKEVDQYVKLTKKMTTMRGPQSLYRFIYRDPIALGTAIAMRFGTGVGYLPSMGTGYLVGLASSYLKSLIRLQKLSPEILDHVVMSGRELEGPQRVVRPFYPSTGDTGLSSPSAPAGLAGPAEPGGVPPGMPGPVPGAPVDVGTPKQISGFDTKALLEAPKETPKSGAKAAKITEQAAKPNESWTIEQYKSEIQRTAGILRNPAATLEERNIARSQLKNYQSELSKLTGDKSVAEGIHGKGRIAEQSKARERVNRVREVARNARAAEIKEFVTKQKSIAETLQIPELEEAVQEHDPQGLKTLKSLRAKKAISDEEYMEGLKFYLLEALDKKGQ